MAGIWGQEAAKLYRDLTTWDARILDAYYDRIDFSEIETDLTKEKKEALVEKHRQQIIDAIKKNKQGEHPTRQAIAHALGLVCGFVLSVSAGFLISAVLSETLGLHGWAAELVAYGAFVVTFFSDMISFRKSVPRILRLLVESDESVGYHLFATAELKVRVMPDGTVVTGYLVPSDRLPGLIEFKETPPERTAFNLKQTLFLALNFCLVIVVGICILAQTIVKAPNGMEHIIPQLVGTGVALPLAAVMAGAAFFCMLGQYTYSVIRFLRNPDKLKEIRELFRQVEVIDGKSNRAEVYLYNTLMVIFSVALLVVLFVGMKGTSEVQAGNLMELAKNTSNMAAKYAVMACAMAGKSLFTVRAAANFVGIIQRSVGSFISWGREKFQNALVHLGWSTGDLKYDLHTPFDLNKSEDQASKAGYLCIGLHALAKASTAVPPPEEGHTTDLFSHDNNTLLWAWTKATGSLFRTFGEASDKFKPRERTRTTKPTG